MEERDIDTLDEYAGGGKKRKDGRETAAVVPDTQILGCRSKAVTMDSRSKQVPQVAVTLVEGTTELLGTIPVAIEGISGGGLLLMLHDDVVVLVCCFDALDEEDDTDECEWAIALDVAIISGMDNSWVVAMDSESIEAVNSLSIAL
jgi:hypothetical protein